MGRLKVPEQSFETLPTSVESLGQSVPEVSIGNFHRSSCESGFGVSREHAECTELAACPKIYEFLHAYLILDVLHSSLKFGNSLESPCTYKAGESRLRGARLVNVGGLKEGTGTRTSSRW